MTGPKLSSEKEIVALAKQGDKQAFAQLVEKHQLGLYRLLVRVLRDPELAEDVVQETFIKAFQKIDSFEGRSAFKSWLFQIGINTARNKMRGKKYTHVNCSGFHVVTEDNTENEMVRQDVKVIIKAEIEQLPSRQKTALMLRVFEDMSFKEIAGVMNCPYDTAKANFRHALMKLKRKIKDKQLLAPYSEKDNVNLFEPNKLVMEVN